MLVFSLPGMNPVTGIVRLRRSVLCSQLRAEERKGEHSEVDEARGRCGAQGRRAARTPGQVSKP